MPFVFAYGSNMDLDHLRDWISRWQHSNSGRQCNIISARRAVLDGYRLCWNYRRSDGSGASNIAIDPQSSVWGVCLEVDDILAIDNKEGFKQNNPDASHYLRQERQVTLDNGTPQTAYIYTARETEELFVSPPAKYKQFVLKGARDFNLPQAYIDTIESVQTREQETEITAFLRWKDRESAPGHDWKDWFQAEDYLNGFLKKCVYCHERKRFLTKGGQSSDFDVEHVIHHAFGRCQNNNPTLVGRVCKQCNHAFSGTIDIAATKDSYEAFLRPKHGLKEASSLSGQDSRRLSVKYTDSNGEVISHPVEPAEAGSPFDIVGRSLATFKLKGGEQFESLDQMQIEKLSREQLMERYDLSAEFPISITGPRDGPQKLRELLESKFNATSREISSQTIDNVHQEIIVDEILQRAYAKIGFNYYVWVCDQKKLMMEPFEEYLQGSRHFVRYGTEPGGYRVANPWTVPDLVQVDGLFANVGHLVMLEYGISEHDNLCLVAKVMLFSNYGYRITLSPKCPRRLPIEIAHYWDLSRNELVDLSPDLHNRLRGG